MEDTPEGDSRQYIPVPKKRRQRLKERPAVLRGIPLDLLCRVCDFKEFTGIDETTFEKHEQAGMPVYQPGTQAEWMFTNDFHESVRSGKVPPPKPRKRIK